MIKHYDNLMNELDNLVLSMGNQKNDVQVVKALKQLYKSRNKFKAKLNETHAKLTKTDYPVHPDHTISAKFLDLIADETCVCR